MKKVILYTICAFLFAGTSYSQVKLGVRGGFNINNIKLYQDANERHQVSYESGLGFHFGLTSQIKISKLFIQPELLFSTSTHNVTVDDILSGDGTEVGKQRFNKVDFPILAGLKFDNNFKVGVGPVFTKIVSSKSDILDSDELNKATVGYQFVAGFDWERFSLEARYEGNLQKYGSGVRIGGSTYDFDARTSQLIISTAFYF